MNGKDVLDRLNLYFVTTPSPHPKHCWLFTQPRKGWLE